MNQTITPQQSFRPAIFYDPDNNPLNIPCEGPRIVPVFCDTSKGSIFFVNLLTLANAGQFSQCQSVWVRPLQGPSEITITLGGTLQNIVFPKDVSSRVVALCAQNIPYILINTELTSGIVAIFFANFMLPINSIQAIIS